MDENIIIWLSVKVAEVDRKGRFHILTFNIGGLQGSSYFHLFTLSCIDHSNVINENAFYNLKMVDAIRGCIINLVFLYYNMIDIFVFDGIVFALLVFTLIFLAYEDVIHFIDTTNSVRSVQRIIRDRQKVF